MSVHLLRSTLAMDNTFGLVTHTSDSKNCRQDEQKMNIERVTNWLNSTADDDEDSTISESTAISSSVVDSEDIDFNSFKISDADSKEIDPVSTSSSNTIAMKQRDLLLKLLSGDNSMKMLGNVNITNCSHVHIGNVIQITGPIYITNPRDPYMKILFDENTTIINSNVLSENSKADQIVARRTWEKPLEPYIHINEPVKYVIISHSATEMATTQTENIYIIKNIQFFHVRSFQWNDIGYNFMIGGDGNVYEGRGWSVVGAHTKGYNSSSVGISFIGSFIDELPPAASLMACKNLIKRGVERGHIAPNYKLVGHCQCSPTKSPGQKLFEELQTWEHFALDL